MKLPCEVIAKEILPSIRSAVVFILYSEYGLTQTEMGITQASVNQYIQETRGKNKIILEQIPEIREKLREMAEIVLSDEKYSDSLCNLCKDIRKDKVFCKIYKNLCGD